MGVLAKLEKETTKNGKEKPSGEQPSAKAAVAVGGGGGQSAGSTSSASAGPDHTCPKCSGGRWWLDSYGAWNCETCRRPRIEAAVRRRHSYGPACNCEADGIEAREDLRALFGSPWQADSGRWWREFLTTEGIFGSCLVGTEREAVAGARQEREIGWL